MTGLTQEYRVAELAEAAGVGVRTVRYYQERGLLAPPRRQGRHALYNHTHLERLTLIADLLGRGHSLEGIADLLTSAEQGGGVSELLGFETVASVAWGDEEVTIDLEEMLTRFGEQATPQAIAEAVELGFLRIEDDHFVYSSGRLLEAATAFVAAGIPLRTVLALSWELQASFDRMAFAFVQEFRTHLLGRVLEHPSPEQLHQLATSLAELRPVVHQVADELFARAMDRRIHADLPEVSEQLSRATNANPTTGLESRPPKTSTTNHSQPTFTEPPSG
ncbi:MerR-like DNA binding protein [Nocardia tenerifensis]|uniref:MerR-like DNA binding protein n=1 Tax=Nocardia tenerifensis TaxID=228006 RepID=A0A318KDU0_9NOCA|nr:MerR family transcriptional regulator [Nocardia tenerifensis]PXX69239.1 MerR-like DNA binding protein [Nocardia tenerifensis]